MPGPRKRETLVRTSIVIPERQVEWLRERADEAGTSVSFFVRAAIDHYRDHPAATLLHEQPEREEIPA